MLEQKCTINDLIDELNKVAKEYGYRRIKEITILINSTETLTYKDDAS